MEKQDDHTKTNIPTSADSVCLIFRKQLRARIDLTSAKKMNLYQGRHSLDGRTVTAAIVMCVTDL